MYIGPHHIDAQTAVGKNLFFPVFLINRSAADSLDTIVPKLPDKIISVLSLSDNIRNNLPPAVQRPQKIRNPRNINDIVDCADVRNAETLLRTRRFSDHGIINHSIMGYVIMSYVIMGYIVTSYVIMGYIVTSYVITGCVIIDCVIMDSCLLRIRLSSGICPDSFA